MNKIQHTILQCSTPNLELSIAFYQQLKFSIEQSHKTNYALGKNLIIEINADRFARAGVKILNGFSAETIKSFPFPVIKNKTENSYTAISPEGCYVYFEDASDPFQPKLENNENTLLGNYNGISLESINLQNSIDFWTQLGFNLTMGGPDKAWAALSDSTGFELNLMLLNSCPHLFSNPGLNFFNAGENPAIISELKALKIPITEEITIFNPTVPAENVIVKDPGGLTFFIFND